ncbi:MAG: hypothetical protein Q7J15_06485 [Candidatus Desulfaltia sp.]|nr:hypothetical protein [Candidatus Desulfaltia sp.]
MYLSNIMTDSIIVIVIGASIFYIRKVICNPIIKRRQTALANLKEVYALCEQHRGRISTPDLRNVRPEIGVKPKKF